MPEKGKCGEAHDDDTRLERRERNIEKMGEFLKKATPNLKGWVALC